VDAQVGVVAVVGAGELDLKEDLPLAGFPDGEEGLDVAADRFALFLELEQGGQFLFGAVEAPMEGLFIVELGFLPGQLGRAGPVVPKIGIGQLGFELF
jgi:hypothetical protein